MRTLKCILTITILFTCEVLFAQRQLVLIHKQSGEIIRIKRSHKMNILFKEQTRDSLIEVSLHHRSGDTLFLKTKQTVLYSEIDEIRQPKPELYDAHATLMVLSGVLTLFQARALMHNTDNFFLYIGITLSLTSFINQYGLMQDDAKRMRRHIIDTEQFEIRK